MKKYICPNCESRNAKPYCNDCDCSIPNNSFIEENEIAYSHISITNIDSNLEIRCPSCDKKLTISKKTCPYCGELLLNGTKYKTNLESKENARRIFETEIEKQKEQWSQIYGALWIDVIIGGVILYLITHLIVSAIN